MFSSLLLMHSLKARDMAESADILAVSKHGQQVVTKQRGLSSILVHLLRCLDY